MPLSEIRRNRAFCRPALGAPKGAITTAAPRTTTAATDPSSELSEVPYGTARCGEFARKSTPRRPQIPAIHRWNLWSPFDQSGTLALFTNAWRCLSIRGPGKQALEIGDSTPQSLLEGHARF